ncbi:MAG: hypothetical protein C7B45_03615 [Sulfobacillus acidophilus]|uniref:DUF86 domain-containing protein n=1 Tax=Sulfobacillus acidophilus TaxID=53633 RepID=A0A2T2WLS6_9FIRM|nr:MAG: hypothetical protein C7B45_03615 [Sulfobacillus acidophilus]
MPKRDNFSTLTRIEEAVQRIKRWTEAISHEEFLDDELRQSAIMRQLEIIGEATGRLTAEFLQDHADVLPWNVMKSMRNVLIHGYDEVDIEIVWTTATQDIPGIHAPLQDLLSEAADASRDG